MFSTQHPAVFIHADGKSIKVEVLNPDTKEMLIEFAI